LSVAQSSRRFAPLETFRSPGYRSLWLASILWNQARWMDQVVLGWVVLEMTNSAWHVALIAAIRWLPLMLFGLFGGAIADRFDRRRLLMTMQAVGLLVSLGTALTLVAGWFNFGYAALVTFLLGLQWAVDWPTRRAMIPDMVGRGLTINAVALEAVSMNITRIAGPLTAGAMLAYVNPAASFLVIAGLYVLQLVVLSTLPAPERVQQRASGPMLGYVRDGLVALGQSQAVVGVLLVSVFMNVLVFPYQQMLPVFARDVLHTGAVGLGLLGAASGVGSLVGALAIASSTGVPRAGLLFWTGSILSSVCIVGFALSGSFPVALVLVAVAGLAQSAFGSLQSTIILGSASDQMRGRAMGVLTLAIGCAPLGTIEIGLATVLVGAPLAVAINSGVSAVLVLAAGLRLPRFRAA
jgi:MFS family permease